MINQMEEKQKVQVTNPDSNSMRNGIRVNTIMTVICVDNDGDIYVKSPKYGSPLLLLSSEYRPINN